MRVGVIRNDLPSPILLADLEQVSRQNAPVDAPGQVRYLSYPTDAALQKVMDDAGAGGITVSALRAAVYTGGSIDVSFATIDGLAWTGSPDTTALTAAIADLVAPQFAETDVAIESFLYGMIGKAASANFNPGVGALGAAVAVVEDDGSTDFSTANTAPVLTTADLGTPSAGDLTLSGTGLGKESGGATNPLRSTSVKLTGAVKITLHQEQIEAAGGSVSDTEIFIPASLLPGAAVTTTSAQVQFRQKVSSAVALS